MSFETVKLPAGVDMHQVSRWLNGRRQLIADERLGAKQLSKRGEMEATGCHKKDSPLIKDPTAECILTTECIEVITDQQYDDCDYP